MSEKKYDVSARGHLQRARLLLATDRKPDMFYAAFELRAGLEARISEYLGEWDHVSPKVKNAWQIGTLDNEVRRAFSGNTKVADVTFADGQNRVKFLYTPVRRAGREVAGHLGNYLHAQKKCRDGDPEWWGRFSSVLGRAQVELTFAVAGTLLGPAMMKAGRNAQLMSEILEGQPIPYAPKRGEQLNVRVAYHPAIDFEIPDDAYAWRAS